MMWKVVYYSNPATMSNKFNIYGCAGVEQYTASHLIEDYVTKYNTKGCLNSDNCIVFLSIDYKRLHRQW